MVKQEAGESSRQSGGSVPDELIEATVSLYEHEPPSTITMRRIAQEAGVSLGFAYNYVESKEQLLAAAMERLAIRLSEGARSGSTPEDRLKGLWSTMEANPAFHRMMASLVLEGFNVSDLMTRHPVIGDVADESVEMEDPALAGAMLAFLGISLQSFELLVNRAAGFDESDPRLRDGVLEMYRLWSESQTG